jgi:hypothetical protein
VLRSKPAKLLPLPWLTLHHLCLDTSLASGLLYSEFSGTRPGASFPYPSDLQDCCGCSGSLAWTRVPVFTSPAVCKCTCVGCVGMHGAAAARVVSIACVEAPLQ